MMSIEIDKMTRREATLVQTGLKALGVYQGTTKGIPGPKTRAALATYLDGEAPSGFAKEMVRLAEGEVGVCEDPVDSNTGRRVRTYQGATWLDGTGWPWCAAFICWIVREAGMAEEHRPQTAGAWDFERWARKTTNPAELIKPAATGTIRKGDLLVYKFSHIGIAREDETGGRVTTIEGNTDGEGSREGGGVWEKSRRVELVRSIIRI
jgi:hypothetical protein